MTEDTPVGEPVSGPASPLPERRPLEGRYVTLLPTEPEHAAGLFEAWHGKPGGIELWTYLPFGPFEDEAAMLAWVTWAATSTDFLYRTVVDRTTDAPVGMASFMRAEPEQRTIELGGIWYAPSAQRTAANTETTYLMLRDSFDVGYRRVEWKCNALNQRSRIAAERLGFTFEGVFRQHMIVKGRNRDTAWFSMLDGEWPRVRGNLERWLDAPPGTVSLRELNAGR